MAEGDKTKIGPLNITDPVVSSMISTIESVVVSGMTYPGTLYLNDIITKSPFVDIRAFGAATTNSDNSTAITNAINYIVATYGGGVVRIPMGTWNISSTINIPAFVYLTGEGLRGTYLNMTNSSNNVINFLTDGYGNNWGGLLKLIITNGNTGVVANNNGHILIQEVYCQYCTTGFHLTQVINSTYVDVEARNCVTGALVDYNGASFSDQSVWIRPIFNFNTGNGMIKKKGQGNTFISFQACGNTLAGLHLEGDLSIATTIPLIPAGRYDNDTFISPYIEGVYNHPELDTGPSLIEIIGTLNTKLDNLVLVNYVTKSGGIINIKQSMDTHINGTLMDFGATSNPVVIDNLTSNPIIDIKGSTIPSIPSSVFGAKVATGNILNPSSNNVLSNSTFATSGTSGSDIFSNWIESGNTSGQIIRDTTDLLLQGTIASCKVVQGVSAVNMEMDQNTSILTPNTQYYINITYKNDNGYTHSNSPIKIGVSSASGSYPGYDFISQTYAASGLTQLELPVSTSPYSMSIPFISPSSALGVMARLIFTNYGTDTPNSIYHIYEFAISQTPNLQIPKIPAVAQTPTPYVSYSMPDADYTFGTNSENVLILYNGSVTGSRNITVPAPTISGQDIQLINQTLVPQNVTIYGSNIYVMLGQIRTNYSASYAFTLAPQTARTFRASNTSWFENSVELPSRHYLWNSNTSYQAGTYGETFIECNNAGVATLSLPTGNSNNAGKKYIISNKSFTNNVNLYFTTSDTVYYKDISGTLNSIPASSYSGVVLPGGQRSFYTDGNSSWIEYGTITGYEASAMPTTGTYNSGDYVRNKAALTILSWSGGFAGLSGAKYVLKGWTRITTGSANVLNTDWVEDRALTGQ